MSFTPAVAQTLRQALATVVADVRPSSRPLPDPVRQEISAILASWGLK